MPAERRCLRLRQADERLLKKSTVYNLTNGRHWEAIAQKAFIIQIYEHRRIGCFSGSLAVVVYQKSNRRALIVPRMSTDGALKKAAQYVHQPANYRAGLVIGSQYFELDTSMVSVR